MREPITPSRWQPGTPWIFVLGCLSFLAADCLLPAAHGASRGLYQVLEIKPQVFVWIPDDVIDLDGDADFARAGNAGFILSPGAVVVINTTNSPFHARDLAYEIQERSEAPVKYVIDTGPEGDEALGNEAFSDPQVVILSTPFAQAAMERYRRDLPHLMAGDWQLRARMRGVHPTPAHETFSGEMRIELGSSAANPDTQAERLPDQSSSPISSLKSGPAPLRSSLPPDSENSQQAQISGVPAAPARPGQTIHLISLPAGAASGDAAVYLPQARVLFLGDLFENGFYPRLKSQFESRDARQWIEILKRVEAWDVDIYVPGHGQPAGKKEVAQFRQFLEWLVNETQTRIQEGKSWEQIRDQVLPGIRAYRWRAPELAAPALEAVYGQLAPAKPSPAPAPGQPGQVTTSAKPAWR